MSSVQWHNERVRHRLQKEISWTIAHKVNDPRIPDMVIVTEINLAPDTRNATVYVSVFGTDKQKESALIALNRAASFIQKCVVAKISIKHFPKLYFKIDQSFDKSEHINSLLEKVKDDLV